MHSVLEERVGVCLVGASLREARLQVEGGVSRFGGWLGGLGPLQARPVCFGGLWDERWSLFEHLFFGRWQTGQQRVLGSGFAERLPLSVGERNPFVELDGFVLGVMVVCGVFFVAGELVLFSGERRVLLAACVGEQLRFLLFLVDVAG